MEIKLILRNEKSERGWKSGETLATLTEIAITRDDLLQKSALLNVQRADLL